MSLAFVLGALLVIAAIAWFFVVGRPWAQPGGAGGGPFAELIRGMVRFAQQLPSPFLPGLALLVVGLLLVAVGAAAGMGDDPPPPPLAAAPTSAPASVARTAATGGGSSRIDDAADDVCTAWEQYAAAGRPPGQRRSDVVRIIKFTAQVSSIQLVKDAGAALASAPVTDEAAFRRAGDAFQKACVDAGWTSSGGSAGGVGGRP